MKTFESVFGYRAPKWNVPRIRIDRTDALQGISRSDQFRFKPVAAVTQEGKAAIVVTGADSDAVATGIESNQRRQYEVQGTWVYQLDRARFWNPVKIRFETHSRPDPGEVHFSVNQDRREEQPAPIESDQRTQIRLAVESKEQSNLPGRAKCRHGIDVHANGCVGRLSFGR